MRIAIWTGNYGYWKSVHPDNLWKADAPQMGGSEAAALSLALELAHRGHHVLMGAKVPYPVHGILSVCPVDMFAGVILAETYDALVSWDDTYLFRFALPHIPVKVVCYQLNDTVVGVFAHAIDAYFHPSQWHADRFAEVYGVPKGKQHVGLTNGTFPLPMADGLPRSNHVVWASSPDRGLHHLLRMWPKVREHVTNAELHIYYDMDKWLSIVMTEMQRGRTLCTTDRALEVKRLLTPLLQGHGVTYHGGVSRARVNTAMLQAKVLAYPCDPIAPTEGFSMTTLEGWAAGCRVLVTDADALQELWGHREGITCLPLPIDDDLWVDQLVKALQADAKPGRREIPEELTWPAIAAQWEGVFDAILNPAS